MLQSMRLQRVRQDLATKQEQKKTDFFNTLQHKAQRQKDRKKV